MRILLTVHHWLDRNAGAAGATLELAKAYRDLGHATQVLSLDDMPMEFTRRTRQFAWYLWIGARLARHTSAHSVDVVDCASTDAVAWGAIRSWRAPTTLLVASSHGLEHVAHEARARERALGHHATTRLNLCHQAIDRAVVSRSLRSADLALFLNSVDRHYAVERLGIARTRARIVPNGISDHFLRLPVPEPRAGKPARIAFIGRYQSAKGVTYAAAVLTELLRDYPDVRVTFLGTDRAIEEIRSDYPPDVATQLEAVSRFERSDLPRLLSDIDILLFPSLAEGWGLAVLEGMACGLVPVATAVGAVPEVVRDGRDGFVVPPRDVQGMRGALERLVRDRHELDRFRQNAYARAQKYSWRRAAAANLQAYEEATDQCALAVAA
jgi:glycosyltransferase involved in cell wall biosynthesis